ncbi:hypothetical protein Q3G72_000361 [Acer saccharum]|nr:hypothetical protein Q3G72_000361 [Acer saccharum]
MVQRLTYRNKHSYATKSNQHRSHLQEEVRNISYVEQQGSQVQAPAKETSTQKKKSGLCFVVGLCFVEEEEEKVQRLTYRKRLKIVKKVLKI